MQILKYFFFFDKKFFAINSPKILLFVSHYHLIPIEAKQFFSSILVVFKIKLRKLCYTGTTSNSVSNWRYRIFSGFLTLNLNTLFVY